MPLRFLRRQRPLRQNLREILLRVLLDDIKQFHAIEFAGSSVERYESD